MADLITRNSDGIEVATHKGTWHVIDSFTVKQDEIAYLLEHDSYGDEAPNLIVNQKGELLVENVYNGFDDLDDAIEDWENNIIALKEAGYTDITSHRELLGATEFKDEWGKVISFENAIELDDKLYKTLKDKRKKDSKMNDVYDYRVKLETIYQYEMINDVSFNDENRFTKIVSNSDGVYENLTTCIPRSEDDVNKRFDEIRSENRISEIRQLYNGMIEKYNTIQQKENCKTIINNLEANACYDMIRADSPWGAWVGNIVNPNKPQDYITLAIVGYNTSNSVEVEASYIKDGNKLTEQMSREFDFNKIKEIDNLSNGFTNSLALDFKDTIADMVGEITNGFKESVVFYGNNNDFLQISNHNEQLKEMGYSIDVIDTTEYDERRMGRNVSMAGERTYYEPQFDFDGTADELFMQARNNHIENPDALHRLQEILLAENKKNEAERVGFMEEREREDKNLYSVAQMKLDMLDGWGGIDDVGINTDETLRLSVMYEAHDDSVNISLVEYDDDGIARGGTSIPYNEFKNMNRQEFDNLVNQVSYYYMVIEENEMENMIENMIENGSNKKEIIPIEEVVINGKWKDGWQWNRNSYYIPVKHFEKNNNIKNPVIDENGQYEDDGFMKDAYDVYVGMSHENEMGEYTERLSNVKKDGVPYDYYAQIYYAKQNGLSEEQIDFMLKQTSHEQYSALTMGATRIALEDGYTINEVSKFADKSYYTQLAILENANEEGFSEVQRNLILSSESQGVAFGCYELFKQAESENDFAKYDTQAEAINDVAKKFKSYNNEIMQKEKEAKENGTIKDGDIFSYIRSEDKIDQFAMLVQHEHITADEIHYIADEILKNPEIHEIYYEGMFNMAKKYREMEKEKAMEKEIVENVSHGEKKIETPKFVKTNTEEINKKDTLLAQIKDGVRDIMTSDKYKAYLETRSRLFYRNFSVNNSIGIFMQKPDASYVNGFDQWKDCGRQVVKGAKAIQILTPVIYHEKYSGGLYKSIITNLSSQLDANPNVTARYRVGMSPLELTMVKNTNSMGVLMNGKEIAMIDTPKLQREFIDMNILGKVPAYFTTANVFDISDTTVPEFLWVKESKCKKEEWALDENGKPQKAKNGSIKIINTDERQAKFRPNLDMSVVEKNPETMKKLFDSLVAVSKRNGVPITIVERESDKTLKNGADGYFRRPTEDIQDKFPKGYIVMPQDIYDNEPTKSVANLIHEMAHSDLHGNLQKLADRMGENKITQDMREVQAESVAYLVGKQYGLDTSTASFSYLANWSKGFDMQSFEKSLDVISREAQKLSSEIGAELDLRGLTQELQEKPLEPLSEEAIRSVAGQYVTRSLEAQREITESLALIPNLMQTHKDSADILYIITKQKKNLDSQQIEVNGQIETATKLENTTEREAQDKMIHDLDSSFNRLTGLKQSFVDESESMVKLAQRQKTGLKEQFIANPTRTLKAMAKTYPQIAELSKTQLSYIAKSQYIEKNLVGMLNDNPQKFADDVSKRANDVMNVTAKNGSFVEVEFCEQWTDKPIFQSGDLCHPKVAEMYIKDGESQIRNLKAESEKNGEYFPYSKCYVSVFTLSEKTKNLSVMNCRVDIGDGTQKGLADFLMQESKSREVVENFNKATRELKAKDKIISINEDKTNNEKLEITSNEENRADMEAWKEEIEKEKLTESNSPSNEENNAEKNRAKQGKNERA